MNSNFPQLLLGLAALSAAACSSEPADELGRCDPPLPITVSSAPPYEFNWTPEGCDVYTFSVHSADAVQWHLFTIEDRGPYTAEMIRINQNGLEELVARQDFTIFSVESSR
jgi:hypothetical protein